MTPDLILALAPALGALLGLGIGTAAAHHYLNGTDQ